MNWAKKARSAISEAIRNIFIVKWIQYLIRRPVILLLLVIIGSVGYYTLEDKVTAYIDEYHRLNSEELQAEQDSEGLTFTQINDNLYTLTGAVGANDCEKIVPLMPETFTVILESPGGNLAEGSCIASHLKIRNVTTVIRDTPVLNEDGVEIYTPGLISEGQFEGKTMCASACSLFFLAGDNRYLIGNVYLGIHGPSTPPEYIGQMNPQQLESSAYKTASALLQLLDRLGVHPDLRLLFIQIPGYTMYWVNPNDFEVKPELATLATTYRNFWGYNASNPNAVY